MEPEPAVIEPPHVPETGFARLRPWHQRLLFVVGGLICAFATLLFGDFGPFFWFAALAWVIAMRVKHGKHVRWISFLVGQALFPIAVVLAMFGFLGATVVSEQARRQEFDPVVWKAAAGGVNEDRRKMVHDLLDAGTLNGMTRAEVIALLGPDDSAAGTGYGVGPFKHYDLVYWLAPGGTLEMGPKWLVIRRDDQGRVEEAQVRSP